MGFQLPKPSYSKFQQSVVDNNVEHFKEHLSKAHHFDLDWSYLYATEHDFQGILDALKESGRIEVIKKRVLQAAELEKFESAVKDNNIQYVKDNYTKIKPVELQWNYYQACSDNSVEIVKILCESGHIDIYASTYEENEKNNIECYGFFLAAMDNNIETIMYHLYEEDLMYPKDLAQTYSVVAKLKPLFEQRDLVHGIENKLPEKHINHKKLKV